MASVLAIAAHPDDIEFLMAGTLVMLERRGWEVHYFNLSTGNCGSATLPAARLRTVRRRESQAAAKVLRAQWHAPIADDLEIFYGDRLLRRVGAVVRRVRPAIVLTHALSDYMEDHMQTARLAVTATFSRGMPNYRTTPRVAPWAGDTVVYHAVPHGLRDPLGRRVPARAWVNISEARDLKRESLACHASQRTWLDQSQGMDSYLQAMEDFGTEVGRHSGRFAMAEGWTRHHPLGFASLDADPLQDALGAAHLLNRGWTTGD